MNASRRKETRSERRDRAHVALGHAAPREDVAEPREVRACGDDVSRDDLRPAAPPRSRQTIRPRRRRDPIPAQAGTVVRQLSLDLRLMQRDAEARLLIHRDDLLAGRVAASCRVDDGARRGRWHGQFLEVVEGQERERLGVDVLFREFGNHRREAEVNEDRVDARVPDLVRGDGRRVSRR